MRRRKPSTEEQVYAELDREFQAGYKRGRTAQLSDAVPYFASFTREQSGYWPTKAYALGFEAGRRALRIDVEAIASGKTSAPKMDIRSDS